MSERAPTLGVDGINPLRNGTRITREEGDVRFRTAFISLLAAFIGFLAGIIAFLLYNLIGLFTNIFFFHRFSFAFTSARNNHLGLW
ncbi:MAG: hypothetical protein WAM71_16195, partial [Candidatus Korobacteraceae bacterium]